MGVIEVRRIQWRYLWILLPPLLLWLLMMLVNKYCYLRTLAFFGSTDAMMDLARVDHSNLVYWTEKAANRGNTTALFGLGNLARSSNPAEALDYYRKGADLGDPNCMGEIAKAYKYGLLGLQGDESQYRYWMDKAMAIDNARSINAWEKATGRKWIPEKH